MQYLKSLEKLGLNQKEQEVYFALLQLEKATANQIAKKSGLKRPTTYDILSRLKKDGFLFETKEAKKHYFVAQEPKKITSILEEKKREILRDLPYLTSIYNTQINKPKVAYFEGIDGIKQLYEDTLISCRSGDEILAYVTRETVDFLDEYSKDYVQRRAKKKIKLRGIYNVSPKMSKYFRKNVEQLREVKVAKTDKYLMKNEINIYADKVIIITYSPEPFGVLIESKEVADTQRAIFEMAWRGIK